MDTPHLRHVQQVLVEALDLQQLGHTQDKADELPSEKGDEDPCQEDVRDGPPGS